MPANEQVFGKFRVSHHCNHTSGANPQIRTSYVACCEGTGHCERSECQQDRKKAALIRRAGSDTRLRRGFQLQDSDSTTATNLWTLSCLVMERSTGCRPVAARVRVHWRLIVQQFALIMWRRCCVAQCPGSEWHSAHTGDACSITRGVQLNRSVALNGTPARMRHRHTRGGSCGTISACISISVPRLWSSPAQTRRFHAGTA
jgi:hypothetical protein